VGEWVFGWEEFREIDKRKIYGFNIFKISFYFLAILELCERFSFVSFLY
jgi:hypothetical protein